VHAGVGERRAWSGTHSSQLVRPRTASLACGQTLRGDSLRGKGEEMPDGRTTGSRKGSVRVARELHDRQTWGSSVGGVPAVRVPGPFRTA
jgi:hypothetical protein